jgi:hypothetical protein
MSTTLDRHAHDARRVELRRLAAALVVLAIASLIWHEVRSGLVCRTACSSIGCPARKRVIAAAVRRHTSGFPTDEELFGQRSYTVGERCYSLSSNCAPPPGYAELSWVREWVPLGKNATVPRWQVAVFDDRLQVRGSVASPWVSETPGDMDGDGRWEVVVEYAALSGERVNTDSVSGWAVVRLGAETNEIVWAGIVDLRVWGSPGLQIAPRWQGEGRGPKELALVGFVSVTLPDGRVEYRPSRTLARFAWDSPGGVLRACEFPGEGGILTWSPGGTRGVVKPETDLEPVLAKLLPVPPAFGAAGPASRAATTASTAPAR